MNVLIALSDDKHDFHQRAVAWFSRDPQRAWATCPITENGFVRIIGHRKYPGFSGGTTAARGMLEALCILPGHQFWPDDLSVRDRVNFKLLPDSRHLTDHYLLGLAAHRKGRLVTLHQGVDVSGIVGGDHALFLIP
ncbi:MAG: TA system VapC family ribonuclease toxin [Akkermansiaceae bacterium]